MEEPELISINIANINEGAILEGFELELRRALENIADLNTPATKTRAVQITLILRPHSDRVTIETEVQCTSKLAPIEAHMSKLFIGKSEDGSPVAFSADPRQLPLWSKPKPKEAPKPLEVSSGA